MSSALKQLTPHMVAYSEEFADSGNINWLPYLMYFHPLNFKSNVVNTDSKGFRCSEAFGEKYSIAGSEEFHSVNVLAGSSTVFGIGASEDRYTLASCLTEKEGKDVRWINFGGRSFNSTQEMILFSLYRHQLPQVDRIVLFSGFNDLGLARLPKRLRLDHGAFFMCNDFYDAMKKKKQSRFSNWFQTKTAQAEDDIPSLNEQIDYAAALTLRNLSNWSAMAVDMGAKLTFVLQPLANWVRDVGSKEEEALFAELERKGRFEEFYGDILTQKAYAAYRDKLRMGAEDLNVGFIDIVSHLQNHIPQDFWLFVDRIHFTDQGHKAVADLLLTLLKEDE